MLTAAQAAELALHVVYAMDMHMAQPTSLAPTPDARLTPKWKILGYLTGTDCLFRRGQTIVFGDDTCYGYLAQLIEKPGVFVAALRGTAGILEWIEDGEFVPTKHPVAGLVESGFWSVYQSLTYRPADNSPSTSALKGLTAVVGAGELVVLGHSLGSAIATYLTFDLAADAALSTRVQGYFFASPRPGNADFAKAFDACVLAYQVWNYELDVVPRVPRGVDYTDLVKVNWIGVIAAQAKISFDLACHHHLLCYCAMLDYSLLDWPNLPTSDRANAVCIKGPA